MHFLSYFMLVTPVKTVNFNYFIKIWKPSLLIVSLRLRITLFGLENEKLLIVSTKIENVFIKGKKLINSGKRRFKPPG